jgi:hypothetical protein
MKTEELEDLMRAFNLFDGALLFHAYTRYMRDYELIVENHVGPAERGTYSYVFKYCVESDISTPLSGDLYRKSLDERLITYETGKDMEGYVWGANWSLLCPGWELIAHSKKASEWQQRIGIEFHEISIQSDAYNITLIFSDLLITKHSGHIDQGINGLFIPL